MRNKSNDPDFIDALLASNRQRLIIEMHNAGQLDPVEAGKLYARTTDVDIVRAERNALEENRTGDPETHSGILSLHLFKRRGRER